VPAIRKHSVRKSFYPAFMTKAEPVRVVIERGPKGKRSVAFGLDWPGWSRGAKNAELALETLESYRERYRPVAVLAGMAREFGAARALEVVEDRVGTGSTDFWGISFSPQMRKGPRGGGQAAHAVVDTAVPHPALRLPHPRPRVGDAGQGSLHTGRILLAWGCGLRRARPTRLGSTPCGPVPVSRSRR